MKIYFVQHGKIPSAEEMKLTMKDEGLSEEGVKEAQEAVRSLHSLLGYNSSLQIITSPRKRATDTAKIFAQHWKIDPEDITIDNRLVERDCKPYDGQSIDDVFSLPEEVLVAGGMEPLASVFKRTQSFYDDLLIRGNNSAVLVVGHSGSLAPLYFASKGKTLGDLLEVPQLLRNKVLQLN